MNRTTCLWCASSAIPLESCCWSCLRAKLDHGTEEDPLVGAKRELSEEAGLEAAHWTYLGCILASPGFSSEVLHMYLARQLTPTPRPPGRGRVSGRAHHAL